MTLLSLLVLMSGQGSESLVAMATILNGGGVTIMLMVFCGGRRNCGSRQAQHWSSISISTCPLSSEWMQVSLAMWTDSTYLEDALCKKNKTLISTWMAPSHWLDESQSAWAYIQIIPDMPSPLRQSHVRKLRHQLSFQPLKMTINHEPQPSWRVFRGDFLMGAFGCLVLKTSSYLDRLDKQHLFSGVLLLNVVLVL